MFFLFFAAWLLLNGSITLQIVLFGLVISAVLLWFICKFMRYSVGTEKMVYRKAGKFIKLICVLIVEIFKSNFALLPYIYNKNKKPEPVVAHFKTDRIKSDTGKVLLANCITMTPGTITGSLKGSDYLVHCLDRSMAQGLDSSSFVDAIQEWEKK